MARQPTSVTIPVDRATSENAEETPLRGAAVCESGSRTGVFLETREQGCPYTLGDTETQLTQRGSSLSGRRILVVYSGRGGLGRYFIVLHALGFLYECFVYHNCVCVWAFVVL